MFGGGSIQLGRLFGIRIGADPSLLLIMGLIVWSLSGYYSSDDLFPDEGTKAFILAVISALLFFVSILLHELGHAVEARRSGIGIVGIDLWMFGGVAKMERDARSAGEEFRVAAAGPAVTLLIAVACWVAATVISGGGSATDALTLEATGGDEVLAVIGYLGSVNLLLLAFNLLPGFPLDGGRIARAIAWKVTGDRTRATRFAGILGRGFSYLLIGVGVFLCLIGNLFTGVWMAFVGVFLGQAARSAVAQTELTSRIEGVSVADVMDAEPVAVPVDLTADRVYDEYFLRYGWPWFPVIDGDGLLAGLITRGSVEELPEDARSARDARSLMASDPGNPDSSLRVDQDEPLETLLGREGLIRLGAVLAVDADGRLRGIVSAEDVRRALRGSPVAI
jgi:Zn-dependent protease